MRWFYTLRPPRQEVNRTTEKLEQHFGGFVDSFFLLMSFDKWAYRFCSLPLHAAYADNALKLSGRTYRIKTTVNFNLNSISLPTTDGVQVVRERQNRRAEAG